MKNVTKMKKKPNKEDYVGKRIEYARREKLMTQDKLAELIGNKKREQVNQWENNQRVPDIYTLKEISKALQVSTDFLLGLTDFESPKEDYKIVNKVTGLNDNAITILDYFNNEYGGLILIPMINFLIEQEELPIDKIAFEKYYQKLNDIETTKENKDTKTKIENKLNDMYEKKLQEWKNQDLKPIISMLETYFTVEIENDKIYTRERDFNNKIPKDLLPKTVLSSEDLLNREYLSRIENITIEAKRKYMERKKQSKK